MAVVTIILQAMVAATIILEAMAVETVTQAVNEAVATPVAVVAVTPMILIVLVAMAKTVLRPKALKWKSTVR